MILGLDFGGTKLAAGVVSAAGQLMASRRCATPAGAAPASLQAMQQLARELIAEAGPIERIGVSFGGPVAADGRTVRLSMHVAGWEHAPLAEWLESAFGVPCALANDGDAAALAEHRFGAGRGVRHLLYLTLSTGIGGGVIIGEALHRGEHAWAGEVGHLVLQHDGPPCPCGRNGCLESLASGLSIAREARVAGAQGLHGPSMLDAHDPAALTAALVAQAAAAGDPRADAVWSAAMRWIGIGIASAANLLNPGRVVLGGGLTRAGALLLTPVSAAARARALDPALQIVPAALGDDVGILGAAAVA